MEKATSYDKTRYTAKNKHIKCIPPENCVKSASSLVFIISLKPDANWQNKQAKYIYIYNQKRTQNIKLRCHHHIMLFSELNLNLAKLFCQQSNTRHLKCIYQLMFQIYIPPKGICMFLVLMDSDEHRALSWKSYNKKSSSS